MVVYSQPTMHIHVHVHDTDMNIQGTSVTQVVVFRTPRQWEEGKRGMRQGSVSKEMKCVL